MDPLRPMREPVGDEVIIINNKTSTTTLFLDGSSILVDNSGYMKVTDSNGEEVPIEELYKGLKSQKRIPEKFRRFPGCVVPKSPGDRFEKRSITASGERTRPDITQDPAYSRRWDRDAPFKPTPGSNVFASGRHYQGVQTAPSNRQRQNSGADRKRKRGNDSSTTAKFPSPPNSSDDDGSSAKKAKLGA